MSIPIATYSSPPLTEARRVGRADFDPRVDGAGQVAHPHGRFLRRGDAAGELDAIPAVL
jgi:hypothetical protein